MKAKKVKTQQKKIRFISCILGVLVLLVLSIYASSLDAVMYVNNSPVHRQELQWSMEDEEYRAKDRLAKAYHIEKEDFSWEEVYGGKTGYDYLIEAGLEEVIRTKVQQQEAKERGLIKEIDYSSFKKAWEMENKSRSEKIAKGQVVYGPEHYEEKQYYDYIMNNLVIGLKTYLQDNELNISDEEAEEVYNLNKAYFLNESLESVKNNVQLLITTQKYEEILEKQLEGAKITRLNKKEIQSIIQEMGDV